MPWSFVSALFLCLQASYRRVPEMQWSEKWTASPSSHSIIISRIRKTWPLTSCGTWTLSGMRPLPLPICRCHQVSVLHLFFRALTVLLLGTMVGWLIKLANYARTQRHTRIITTNAWNGWPLPMHCRLGWVNSIQPTNPPASQQVSHNSSRVREKNR